MGGKQATPEPTAMRIACEEYRQMTARIAALEAANSNLRRKTLGGRDAARLEDDFVGVDVGTLAVSWARVRDGELDDFDTVPLREQKTPLGEARRALRYALPDMVTRWQIGGDPTVVAIEEPMSMGFRASKGMGVFKTMLEEALVANGHVIAEMVPSRWHAVVRSLATGEQMSRFRVTKKGRNVLNIKGLAMELAHEATLGSPARVGLGEAGAMLQDECDAYWIATRARLDYRARRAEAAGEA